MSSTFNVADSSDDKEGSMILILNTDGTITVDQLTLNKLIANQYDDLSVVRVDGESGSSQSDVSQVNLTIEGFGPTTTENVNTSGISADTTVTIPSSEEIPTGDGDVVIDPFSQMDPEQLERLENALQSEQAKEILGTNLEENLLEMLEGGDGSTLVGGGAVHNDHSYTTPLSSPVKQSPAQAKQPTKQAQPPQQVTSSSVPSSPVTVNPTVSIPRLTGPTTRGGRTRGRGSRGGMVSSTTKVSGTVILGSRQTQPASVRPVGVVKTRGGIPSQRIIVRRGGKLVTSSTPTNGVVSRTPKILQRRVLAPKPVEKAATAPTEPPKTPDATVVAAQSLVDMATELQNTLADVKESLSPTTTPSPPVKKVGRGGRRSTRGKIVAPASIPLAPAAEEDEMAAALEALGVGSNKASQQVKKIAPKPATPKALEPVQTTKKTKTPHKVAPSTKSPEGRGEGGTEEVKKRKEKGERGRHKEGGAVMGPELFSTPDIIRRVSVDKPARPEQDLLTIEEKLEKIDESSSYPPSTASTVTPVKCEDQGTESLLNSLTDVSKDDSTALLADALFLDELTSQVLNENAKEMTSLVEGMVKEVAIKPNNQKAAPLSKVSSGPKTPATPRTPVTPKTTAPAKAPVTPKTPVTGTKMPVIAKIAASPKTSAESSQLKKKQTTLKLPKNNNSTRLEIRKLKSPHLNKKITVVIKEKKPAAAADSAKTTPVKRQSTRKRVLTEKAAAFMSSIIDREEEVVEELSEVSVETPEEPPAPPPQQAEQEDDDEDDTVDSDVESWNSEDDPDRLWCICQKPHNNRFMICCDTCEDWFHGKCVGISKALGQQMEAQGIEWSCPNCKEKKEAKLEAKAEAKQKPAPPATVKTEQSTIGSLECVNCQKPAKANSSYCSDVCIKKHVLQRLVAIKKETHRLQGTSRVVVLERRSGKLLTGDKAPTADGLLDWLLSHPTFEVVEPSTLPNYVKLDQPKPPAPKKMGSLKQTVLLTKSLGQGVKQMTFSPKPPVTQKQATPTTPHGNSTPAKVHSKNDQVSNATPKVQPKIDEVLSTAKATPKTEQVHLKASVKKEVEKESLKKVIKISGVVHGVVEKKPAVLKAQAAHPPTQPQEKKERKRRESESAGKVVTPAGPVVAPVPAARPPESDKQTQEPVRANVRRTLQELLNQRIKEDTDFKDISNDQVKELSLAIEEELFKVFNDTGAKYKSKYRSLVFNIKDPKNLTLYKKIVGKLISPSQLVRLTPEELASQELAQWREKEAKHQMDIIKKNELDLIHQAKTVVLKSRKGEEVIESKPLEKSISELESALNRTADDVEEELPGKKESSDSKISEEELMKLQQKLKTKDKDEKGKERRRDKKKRSRSRSKSRSKKSRRSRSRHRSRSDSRGRSHMRSRHRSKSRHKDKRKEDVKEEPCFQIKEQIKLEIKKEQLFESNEVQEAVTPEDPLTPKEEENLREDSDDLEPSSTVTISTPPYPVEEEKPWVWAGTLNMVDVTKLFTRAYQVSGNCDDLFDELSDHLECVGRITPDSVWEYVSRMKKSGTKEIVVIRFSADTEEEKMNYLSLYSYLNSRNRMAVIGNVSRTVKDFYVFPLAGHCPVPQVLLPLDGPGFDDYRTHLLLGIIIRSRKWKHSRTEGYNVRSPERSYTPPLPADAGGSTPPLSAKIKPHRGITPPLLDDDEPYEPQDDSPYSPEDDSMPSLTINPPDIQKNLEEVDRMIQEKRQHIESLAAQVNLSSVEEAYSPGRYTPPRAAESIPFLDSKSLPNISIPSNLQEILASIKSPPRTSPPLDMKSDPIVKAYASAGPMYPLDEEDEYSRSSSATSSHKADRGSARDPRKRDSKSSLSQLTEQDLIKKAAEMGFTRMEEDFPAIVSSQPTTSYYPGAPPPKPPPPSTPVPSYHPPGPPPPSTYHPPPPSHKYKDLRGKRKPDGGPPPMPPLEGGERFDKRMRRGKWDGGMRGHGSHRMRGGPPRGHPHRGGYRGGNYPPGRFNHRYHNPSRYYRPKFDGIQNEWDEEIRNFEQRKSKEAAERRKRRSSRSPSPKKSRSRRSPPR